ncbi:hypothetical protein KIN20_009393, partial [Parelaphostrongylus tenuis]
PKKGKQSIFFGGRYHFRLEGDSDGYEESPAGTCSKANVLTSMNKEQDYNAENVLVNADVTNRMIDYCGISGRTSDLINHN